MEPQKDMQTLQILENILILQTNFLKRMIKTFELIIKLNTSEKLLHYFGDSGSDFSRDIR